MTRVSWHLICCTFVICLLLISQKADAHGSVGADGDLCVIQIGYLKAHFKIYLPRSYQREEFCEDLPEATESLFVMEYEHDGLREMLIDFRIIRDVTGLGKFTRRSDIEQIDDPDAATVFHQPARIDPDVFTAVQHFDRPGWYIGVVTATSQDKSQVHMAVFPFEVGFTGFGYWPMFIVLIIFLQLFHWAMNGSLSRWRDRFRVNGSAA